MTAETEVIAFIENSREYAADSFNNAVSLLNQAVTAAQGFVTLDAVSIPGFNTEDVDTALAVDELPEFSAVFNFSGTLPTLGTLQPVVTPEVDFDALVLPEEIDTSVFFDFDRPSTFEGTPPDEPAGIGDPLDLPDSPTIAQPDVPVLTDITPPDKPTLTLPEFDQTAPPAPPALTEDLDENYKQDFYEARDIFRDYWQQDVDRFINSLCPDLNTGLATLKAKLEDYLNGDTATGLSEATEQAIFDRARARIRAEYQGKASAAVEEAARRGFTLAQPFQTEEVRLSTEQSSVAAAAQATEIAIKQAELEQQNIQFAINASSQLYNWIVSAGLNYGKSLLDINSQANTFAKALLDAAVQVYNNTVRLYELQLSNYRVEADLYRTRLEASLAQIKIFEAEVRLEGLISQLNQQQVETYQARIQAETEKVNLYRAQLAGVGAEIERRNALINLYRGQLEGFRANVAVKELDVRVYEALIRGDRAKLEAELTTYDVYKTRVQSETAKAALATQTAQLTNTANKNIVDVFEAELRGYLGNLDASKSVFDGEVREYLGRLEAFKAELDSRVKSIELKITQNKTNTDVNVETARLNTTIQVQQGQLFQTAIQTQAEAAVNAAKLYANIAESAVGSQNSLIELASQTVTEGTA